MAYNRIYLKCRVCGATFMLAKSYGNGFYREDYNRDGVLKGFNNFLDRHTFCGDSCEEGDFVLDYENMPLGQDLDGMQQWREGFQDGLKMMKEYYKEKSNGGR